MHVWYIFNVRIIVQAPFWPDSVTDPYWFGTLCVVYTNMASGNVYACWGTFKREYLAHLLRVGELILSFAIGTITLICYGTQFWVETADYRQGLWIKCSTKPNVPCETLPLVVDQGKGKR